MQRHSHHHHQQRQQQQQQQKWRRRRRRLIEEISVVRVTCMRHFTQLNDCAMPDAIL